MSTTVINNREQESRQQRPLLIFAYLTLLCSLSVYGFWQALLPAALSNLIWGQMGVLVVLLVITQFWQVVRPLRGFVLVSMLVTVVTAVLIPLAGNSALLAGWSSVENPTFWQANSGSLFLKLAAALIIIALLLAMGLRRADFFLVKGQIDAPATPVRWLGMKNPRPWTKFGGSFAILSFLIILSVTLLPNLPRWGMSSLLQALPWLPAALLFAAINGIYEEVVFRAAFLSQLERVVGAGHALAITVLLFGLSHLAGSVPSGAVGVLLAAFFAFISGKAMLETRGMTWPWICHFAADTAVFIFLAIATTAGAM